MSEQNSSQDKSEEASQQKLKKSREEGQVARSKDLATTVSLLVTLLVLKFSGDYFLAGLQQSFRLSYLDLSRGEMSLDDLDLIISHNLMLLMHLLAPLLITPLLVCVFALVPGGWVFASKNFSFRAEKLNPLKGLKRIFSLQNFSELGKSLLKIVLLGVIAWWLIGETFPQLLALQRGDIHSAIVGTLSLSLDLAISLLLVFILFSLIDIPLQRFFHLKQLRMTKQELREEHKNQEGRPEVKARIKQLQRQLLHRQIGKVIKDADVVIVNPQHYAVALRYDMKKAQAPFVIARGIDETALFIRQLASKHGLEVLELPPLARAIYFSTQVNQQIPNALFKAVAQVLTYVLQLKAYRQGRRRSQPQLSRQFDIPASLANKGQA
ncbi:Flagellar biosynthetic protein FlhB [Pseudomonas sp. 8AS]|uniref:flagellar biosynthesis protein FlhB n=1 Tax=Pseudomonas sp. 8AS TaxID=2653163 RepID=UPI0012F2B195|nr:flagellar biosynthesis protein FlhB [Pseudomonas sp. 8AS]VXC27965.1 Flagellar biosynthetic protein FlhB [Pseudomonas sp. 8AS]